MKAFDLSIHEEIELRISGLKRALSDLSQTIKQAYSPTLHAPAALYDVWSQLNSAKKLLLLPLLHAISDLNDSERDAALSNLVDKSMRELNETRKSMKKQVHADQVLGKLNHILKEIKDAWQTSKRASPTFGKR